MRWNNKVSNVANCQPKIKTYVSNKYTKKNKKELMKVIRDHYTTDDIKANFQTSSNDFDFKKQNSEFNLPTTVCRSKNPSKIIGKYFNINRYGTERTIEFKRNTANNFVLKVYQTPRKVLLNYSPFKNLKYKEKSILT